MLTDDYIKQYILVHEEKCLYSILQTLKYFDIEHEVTEWLDNYMDELRARKRRLAESCGNKRALDKVLAKENPKLRRNKRALRPPRKNIPSRLRKKGIERFEDRKRVVERELKVVVGMCSCGATMVGEPLAGCERKKSGRVFYKECTACTHYVEIFKKDNKYEEIEGGIENGV